MKEYDTKAAPYKYNAVIPGTVLSQAAGEEVVLLNLENGERFGLDRVGARIWALLQDGVDMGTLLGALAGEYDVSASQLSEDVGRFLEELQRHGLVKLVEESR